MPDLTPDLDAIRERLKDVYRPTFGLIAWSEVDGLHFMVNTKTISQERALRIVQAIAAAPTDVAALLAEVERLRKTTADKDVVVRSLANHLKTALAELDRLRPMEAALAAVRELLSADADAYPDEISGWDICAKAYELLTEPDGGASDGE